MVGKSFLSNVFHTPFAEPYKHYAVNILYRTQTAFAEYHAARALTHDYLACTHPEQPQVRLYFGALARWEFVFQNLAVVIDLINKFTGINAYENGDGSSIERTHGIAVDIRHCGGRIDSGLLSGDKTVPVWLTNAGFRSVSRTALSFAELAKVVDDTAGIADELQDAGTFMEKLEAVRAASEGQEKPVK